MFDLLVTKVFAASTDIPTEPINPLGGRLTDFNSVFVWITNLVIILGLALVVVFLAMGFIRFITSQGDKVATEQAQKWVTYAVIGGVGLFLVYAIKGVILNLVGQKDDLLGGND